MVKIYGIHNCDTMQKALKWLQARGVKYEFHNYKEAGIDRDTLEVWLLQFPANQLINTKSTTFRALSEDDRAGIDNHEKALDLMQQHNSIIKRPVWDFGNGTFFLGWKEQEIAQLLPED